MSVVPRAKPGGLGPRFVGAAGGAAGGGRRGPAGGGVPGGLGPLLPPSR